MENIKKITFKFKSGYITKLESDTIISYVIANDFDNLIDIYDDFKRGNLPFVITNAFDNGFITRPFYVPTKKKDETKEENLVNDIKEEPNRKKLKKLRFLPLDPEILQKYFEGKDYLEKNDISEPNKVSISEFKNAIPRFNAGDTNPYAITVNYTDTEKVIYVKVYDEAKYKRFFDSLKKVFETIGWGKGKSRGYGKIQYVKEENLQDKEKEFFDYVQKLKKENKYIVWNNYKPSDEDLKNIDIEKSFLDFNHKHTKALGNMPFKGKMSFISAGSVIVVKDKAKGLKGDFYKTNDGKSINFGYLF